MEIKFRGKRLDNGEWAYGQLLQSNASMFIVYMVGTLNSEKIIGLDYHKVDPATVGMFTGERDNKPDGSKQDIYSGDTLLITDEYNGTYTTTVRFEDGAFVVDVQGMDYDITSIGWAIEEWDNQCCRSWEVVEVANNPALSEEGAIT